MNAPSDDDPVLAAASDEPLPELRMPEGKSPEEIEAEMPEGLTERPAIKLDEIRARLEANRRGEEPAAPRFLLSEAFAVITALAVGLGLGRIDPHGVFAIGFGFLATIFLVQALLFGHSSRMWLVVGVCAICLYIGTTFGSAFLLINGGADAGTR